ncbi:MAG: hypothetical protein AB1540_02740 [Bdellovibrionota bacterium]
MKEIAAIEKGLKSRFGWRVRKAMTKLGVVYAGRADSLPSGLASVIEANFNAKDSDQVEAIGRIYRDRPNLLPIGIRDRLFGALSRQEDDLRHKALSALKEIYRGHPKTFPSEQATGFLISRADIEVIAAVYEGHPGALPARFKQLLSDGLLQPAGWVTANEALRATSMLYRDRPELVNEDMLKGISHLAKIRREGGSVDKAWKTIVQIYGKKPDFIPKQLVLQIDHQIRNPTIEYTEERTRETNNAFGQRFVVREYYTVEKHYDSAIKALGAVYFDKATLLPETLKEAIAIALINPVEKIRDTAFQSLKGVYSSQEVLPQRYLQSLFSGYIVLGRPKTDVAYGYLLENLSAVEPALRSPEDIAAALNFDDGSVRLFGKAALRQSSVENQTKTYLAIVRILEATEAPKVSPYAFEALREWNDPAGLTVKKVKKLAKKFKKNSEIFAWLEATQSRLEAKEGRLTLAPAAEWGNLSIAEEEGQLSLVDESAALSSSEAEKEGRWCLRRVVSILTKPLRIKRR